MRTMMPWVFSPRDSASLDCTLILLELPGHSSRIFPNIAQSDNLTRLKEDLHFRRGIEQATPKMELMLA